MRKMTDTKRTKATRVYSLKKTLAVKGARSINDVAGMLTF